MNTVNPVKTSDPVDEVKSEKSRFPKEIHDHFKTIFKNNPEIRKGYKDFMETRVSSKSIVTSILENRKADNKPLITFENGKIQRDNYISKKITKEHVTLIGVMHQKVQNRVNFCQSYPLLFHEAMMRMMDRRKGNDLYYEMRDGVRVGIDINIDEMSTEHFEDIAVYAMMFTEMKPCFSPPINVARAELLKKIEPIAREQILKYWEQFVGNYENDQKQMVQEIMTGWYIYIAFLIKRTYGVNVFTGDGKDFCLAYFCMDKNVPFLGNKLKIQHQIYSYYHRSPGQIKTSIFASTTENIMEGKPKELLGHFDFVMDDGICILYCNGKTHLQLTILDKRPSPLNDLFFALSRKWGQQNPERIEIIRHFDIISQVFKGYAYAFEAEDFIKLLDSC